MCGLYGMIAKFKNNAYTDVDMEIFMDMAVLTSLRGKDSSSIWGLGKNALDTQPPIWKTIGDPFYLLNGKMAPRIKGFMRNHAISMFGHGRKATSGSVSIKNCHPFVHDNIVLMHNGTISGGLEDKEKDKEVEVDSHALTLLVEEKGVKEALSSVQGAFAIISYDTNTKKISIARNSMRPLHYVETTDMIFIMSEKDALDYILKRHSRLGNVVKEFESMKVYEVDPNCPRIETPVQITYPKPAPYTYDTGSYLPSQHSRSSAWLPDQNKQVFDDSKWSLKRGEIVNFFVEDCVLTGNRGNYKYIGYDTCDNEIVFFLPTMREDWMNRWAQGEILASSEVPDDDGKEKRVYITAPPKITWYGHWDSMPIIEKDKLVKTETCVFCGQGFVSNDAPDVCVTDVMKREFVHGCCAEDFFKWVANDGKESVHQAV